MSKKNKNLRNRITKSSRDEFQHKASWRYHTPVDNPDDDLSARPWAADLQWAVASGALLFSLYVVTLHPSIPGGDSGELIVSAHELGVAHPPGYPLFTMSAKLVMIIFPFGSIAWRVNLLNALYSAVAGSFLQLAIHRHTGCISSGILAMALFCLSPLAWSWSVTAEVFGLNNLFIAFIMLLTVHFQQVRGHSQMLWVAYFGAFISGLSLCNQHTIIFYVGCIAVSVMRRLQKKQLLTSSSLCRLFVCFVSGLTPYIYLPISSFLHRARWTWGDQSTITGFFTHFLRLEYGTFDLGKDQEGLGFLHGLSVYGLHVWSGLFYIGIPLILLALIDTYRSKDHRLRVPLVFPAMVSVYVLFFAWRANLDTSNPLFMGVVERFWLQSDLVLAGLAGCGFLRVQRWLAVLIDCDGRGKLAACAIAILITIVQCQNLRACDQHDNYVVRDFAEALFDSIPANSLVLTKGDLPTNSMRYLHLCEGIRPDIQLIDQEVLSYKWSLPMLRKYFPEVTFPGDFWALSDGLWPDGKTSFSFRSFLDANFDKFPGMYVCIGMQDRDLSWQKSYTLWPHGVCHRVQRHVAGMDPYSFSKETGYLTYHWQYPHDGFSDTSWEKVANDEMWQAKIGTAFFLYQQGAGSSDPASQLHLFNNSYQLYKQAIQHHKPVNFPAFWHKNFALVCERLLSLDHSMDKVEIIDESIRHFQIYVGLARDDPDVSRITDAIDVLNGRRKLIQGFQKVEEIAENIEERHAKLG